MLTDDPTHRRRRPRRSPSPSTARRHQFPKGTNVLEAARRSASTSPSSATTRACRRRAVCRQCLVDVEGTAQAGAVLLHAGRRQDGGRRPTRRARWTSRRQMLEFTLVNHPIDCPICDKAGECTLQKHYFDWDAKFARNDGIKVQKAKVVDLGPHIVLDQERCILCTRCIRVCDEVAGSHQLEMAHRGDHEVLTTAPGRAARQPVLAQHRRRLPGRRADREGLPVHDARLGARRDAVGLHRLRDRLQHRGPRTRATRSTAWCRAHNPDVNKYWMCDEGRFTYKRAARRSAWRRRCRRPAGRLGPRARRRRQAAARGARREPPARSASCSTRSRPTRTTRARAGWRSSTCSVEPRLHGGQLDQGWRDDILRQRRQEPEHRGRQGDRRGAGCAACSISPTTSKPGAVTALLVLGDARRARPGDGAARRCRWTSCETLVALGDAPARRWSRHANVALPLADWAEVDGTITNRQGMVQRMRAAIAAAGRALPGWEILSRLARKLGATLEFVDGQARCSTRRGRSCRS